MAAWNRAIAFVIRWEGGYVNHPSDPGGETKYGISKAAYPLLNIKDLTLDEAIAIYNSKYWMPMGCFKMPDALALFVFDSAINVGPSRVKKWLKECGEGLNILLAERENYYRFLALKDRFKPFLNGWLNRLESLRKEIISIQGEQKL